MQKNWQRKKIVVAISAIISAGLASPLAVAQSAPATAPKTDKAQNVEQIVVTGSRVAKQDLDSNSPILTITSEELRRQQDITLETFLNTLPQVNPAATTTSNNPSSASGTTPNAGQATIDLRGLGPNRNLVLIDGRRAMVSSDSQTVDLNTIPLALVESIEIISGGAGAVYGADAIAGVINIKMKRRFEGIDARFGWTNSQEFRDTKETNASIVMGGNFAGDRGNAVMAFEYSDRQPAIKNQRSFAAVATATTSYFPEGTYRPSGTNLPSQSAVDALFGRAAYGASAAGTVPNSSALSFNSDGSLFYPGIFNSPRNVVNFRYPVDSGVNTNLYPDVYVYNFDAVNILVSPLERKSVMGKAHYTFGSGVEAFTSFSNTLYTAATALAPTPVSTVTVASPQSATSQQASSNLVTAGQNVGTQLIVPTTNPFIPADLRTILSSRTGDDPRIIGSGATEPFLMRWRVVATGLRQATYENNVTQYSGGLKGNLPFDTWRWDAHISEGRTKIINTQSGNIDTQRLINALGAADGGASLCAGGVNPFGRQALSAACQQYLAVKSALNTEFTQTIGQAFASGEVGQTGAGAVSAVFGAEFRNFKYIFDPGSAAGPTSGFTNQTPSAGRNSFRDLFAELSVPLLRNAPLAKSLELHFAWRSSESQARDNILNVDTPKNRSGSWAIDFSWETDDTTRIRGSAQKSVRAPNFGELFGSTSSAPQIFDPCSVTSIARTTGANAARLATLCRDAGQAGGLGGAVGTYVQTPGTQAAATFQGNLNLKPETGESYTLGLVWIPKLPGMWNGLRGSVDYYSIKIKDGIQVADSNEYIADCYNYYGRNPNYNPAYQSCAQLFRAGDILGVSDLTTANGNFPTTNGGVFKTQGLDVSVGWGNKVGPGKLDLSLAMNYLLAYKNQTLNSFPTNDFTGTIPYFGTPLGQAFPKIKANLTGRYVWGPVSFDARWRYIDGMKNRMGVIFPGENFSGTPAATYLDLGAGYSFGKHISLRVGLNNALDKKPPTYAPNVQSGTDPSTYDVVGRRVMAQLALKF